MARHGDDAREALLDAAEELFARHGIDAVSNRRIAEHAGSANHSAIAYHFGSRDDLLRALYARHVEAMAARRAVLLATLGPDRTLRDLVVSRLLPFVQVLAALPRPSWRARFLAQLRSVPAAAELVRGGADVAELARDLDTLLAETDGVSRRVMTARSGLLGHMVLGVCAEYEERMETGEQEGDWITVGWFLVDAAAGMLAAPVTRPDETTHLPAGLSPL